MDKSGSIESEELHKFISLIAAKEGRICPSAEDINELIKGWGVFACKGKLSLKEFTNLVRKFFDVTHEV